MDFLFYSRKKMNTNQLLTDSYNWSKLYRIGGLSALLIVALIPIQLIVFISYPPPTNAADFFELFNRSWFLGLLSLDLLYIVNNTLIMLVYLGLFAVLRRTDFAMMLIAISIGFVGISAYFSSNTSFEMLSLSNQFQRAESEEIKQQLLASGNAMLTIYRGTAFDVYYVLNAITLLIISRVMFVDGGFTKSTALWGLISGFFMIIPSTAGVVGLIFSLISLIPWTVFSIRIAITLFKMSRSD